VTRPAGGLGYGAASVLRRASPQAVVALVAAVALGACGGDDAGRNAERFEGDLRDAAQVVDDLETASRDGDAARICDELFAPVLAGELAKRPSGSCEKEVDGTLVRPDERIEVEELTGRGGQAFALVREQDGNRTRMRLEKQGDDWRIAALAAVR
jgi:hypothetical protein